VGEINRIKLKDPLVSENNTGIIFDIERNALVDGPGIRTVIFFKGCPLKCAWCHNPESQAAEPQLTHTRRFCIGCGHCLSACPRQAISADSTGLIVDRKACDLCGECVRTCFAKCWAIVGERLSVDEILAQVRKNAAYYRYSQGGVTISGGEPLFQSDFLINLARRLNEEGIHIAVDTSGYAIWEKLKQVAAYADMFLYDIKHIDSRIHKELTGVPNEMILDNLRALAMMKKKLVIRIPVIPSLNDSPENIGKIAEFIAKNVPEVVGVELLPFTRLGSSKYKLFGVENKCEALEPPAKEQVEHLCFHFAEKNIDAQVNG
jgi:pyruvate formate lyase activating enzyme